MAITLKEAAEKVGVSTNSLIYLGSNAHGKINMWSKYKPVRYPDALAHSKDYSYEPFPSISGWTDVGSVKDNWWRAVDGSCGIEIKSYSKMGSNTSGMIKDMMDGISWSYNPPSGTSSEPYRLSDFDGYNPNAVFPLTTTLSSIIYLSSSGSIDFRVEDAPISETNLKFSDIATSGVDIKNMYLGVFLVKNSGSSIIYGTSSSVFGTEGSSSVTLSGLNSYAGVWQCGFYLCSEKITQNGQTPESAIYIPLAIPVKQITIYAAGAQVTVKAYGYWEGSSGFYYSYEIKNDSSNTQVTGINIRLMRRTSEDYANGEVVKSLLVNQTKYVPIGYQYVYDDVYVSYTKDSKYEYYLQMTADNATTTYTVLEEGFEIE
jgi:hypothetical protein